MPGCCVAFRVGGRVARRSEEDAEAGCCIIDFLPSPLKSAMNMLVRCVDGYGSGVGFTLSIRSLTSGGGLPNPLITMIPSFVVVVETGPFGWLQ